MPGSKPAWRRVRWRVQPLAYQGRSAGGEISVLEFGAGAAAVGGEPDLDGACSGRQAVGARIALATCHWMSAWGVPRL
jgi:hypothetical protein